MEREQLIKQKIGKEESREGGKVNEKRIRKGKGETKRRNETEKRRDNIKEEERKDKEIRKGNGKYKQRTHLIFFFFL